MESAASINITESALQIIQERADDSAFSIVNQPEQSKSSLKREHDLFCNTTADMRVATEESKGGGNHSE
jgi:hypothetical protein